MPEIKRNAMGKVNKKDLILAVFGDTQMIRRRSLDSKNIRMKCQLLYIMNKRKNAYIFHMKAVTN